MIIIGTRIPASELKRIGVVEPVVSSEKLMKGTLGSTREIALKSPMATSLAKLTLNTIKEMSIRGYRFEQEMTGELQTRRGHVSSD